MSYEEEILKRFDLDSDESVLI